MNRHIVNFNSGLETIQINDDPNAVIRFNPRDLSFPDKFAKLHKLTTEMVQDLSGTTSADEMFGKLNECGEAISASFDTLFGKGSSEVVFSGANPLSFTVTSEGGEETVTGCLMSNFIEAISPYIHQKFEPLLKAREEKIQAHIKNAKRSSK